MENRVDVLEKPKKSEAYHPRTENLDNGKGSNKTGWKFTRSRLEGKL